MRSCEMENWQLSLMDMPYPCRFLISLPLYIVACLKLAVATCGKHVLPECIYL